MSHPRTVTPAWDEELDRAFPLTPSGDEGYPAAPGEADRHGFMVVVGSLLRRAGDRLRREAGLLPGMSSSVHRDSPCIPWGFLSPLEPLLSDMMTRTLVLEMHVARLGGLLAGDTPQARFASYLGRLRDPAVVRALFREYVVLARRVVRAVDHRVRFSLEFLRHLAEDWPALCAAFAGGGDPGELVHVAWNAGDQHRSGRSVLVVRFASGLRLVYKPRSLAVEASFQRLLAWVNGCGTETPFRVLRVLDRGGHGWMEFVEAGPCQTPAEVRRFYRRQGGYLALLYALAATDFHHENVIAAGEHPVLVDLEALFHRRPADADGDPVRAGVKEGVLAVMLLPRLYFSEKSDRPIDLSGLGTPDGQPAPFGTPAWEHSGGDDMRLMFRPGTLATGQNRPTLRGAEVDLPEYAGDLEAGFTSLYELMCRRRAELAERVAAFGDHEVRFIARPTQAYATLLNLCTHPDRLRDPVERDGCLDRLRVHAEEDPCLMRLVEAERADLLEGDIPVFRTRPDSRDLWTSRGERIVEFFDETGVDLVRQRLARLGAGDLARQRWVIRAAQGLQAAYSRTRKGQAMQEGPPAARPAPLLPREEMMAAARRVGETLEALAWRQNGEAGWAGLIPNDPHGWTIAPLTLDLGEGLPGVVLFLAYLGEATGEPRFTALACAGLAGVRRRAAERPPTDGPTVEGLACMLAHLGRLWGGSSGRDDVLALARRLPASPRLGDLRQTLDAEPRRKVPGVEVPDLVGGLAGTGLAWLMRADPGLVPPAGTPVALSLGE